MTSGLTEFDHELVIGSTTRRLALMRENDRAIYEVKTEKPNFRDPFRVIQDNWIDGHGQYRVSQKDMYFEGQSIDTTQEGRVILGPLINTVQLAGGALDSAPVQFIWYNATSEWLCATAGKIYRYDVSSSGVWVAATTDVANITHMCEYEDVMYAAVGASTKYYYSEDGDTWTQTDLADGYANYFLSAPDPDGTSNVLWKAKVPNELCYTTNGKAGGVEWSTAAYIGDITHDITSLFIFNNVLFVGREDNLYQYDSGGGVHAYRDDLKKNQSSNNFKYITHWQTALYHSEGRGMAEVTKGNRFVPMGPLTSLNLEQSIADIGKAGDVVGLSSDKDFIYVAMDEGTNIHLYKGREVRKKGELQWQWCPWVFVGTNACAAVAVCQHSSTDIRLWFGYGTQTAYVIITDNPTADGAARFAPTGYVRMSYDYGTNPEWDELIQSVVTETKGCNATGEDVVIKYRKNTDSSATACTGDITTNGVVETNLTAAIACNRIQFEAHLSSNTNTATPELIYFEAKGIEKPETIRYHKCVYRIASDLEDNAETLRTYLRGGRTSTSLIKFADMRYEDSTSGTSYVWVVMEPDYPREVEIWHEKEQYPEMGIEVVFREVSFTIS